MPRGARIRPEKKELEVVLRSHTYAQTGKIYGVNAGSVGKWARMYGIQRSRSGQHHYAAKVVDSDIPLIRALEGQILGKEVAQKFEISLSSVYDIWNHKTHKSNLEWSV